ncbi:conserved hypothetical protein [Hyphomicrobiales bacterium]|nr:conserved hypothetical protein [Hyphomicrobiales bacterium]CAH1698530.1 conserved hypothetical protein [Hyphomicrobiales bacterium]CAI0342178.1 conserved hypothetical protein [Hyphomicrobiales bacterium]
MFGFLDPFIKQVQDQATEYAAAQSDILRRVWSAWIDPYHALRPAKAVAERRAPYHRPVARKRPS